MATIENFKKVNRAAGERYEKRRGQREKRLKEVSAKGPFAVDDPKQRAKLRSAILNPNDGLALERILGKSDLMGINFIEIGSITCKSVCRIQIRDRLGQVIGFGTGFMVAPNLVLTNNHVISQADTATRSLLDFDFEDDFNFIPRDTKTFSLDPDKFFHTDQELDFSLIYVNPTSSDNTALEDYGYLRLRSESGKALLDEYVTIVQHPNGLTKKLAIRDSRIVDVDNKQLGQYLHYSTDTQPGSSGSPVFNDQWEVVALHHAGVTKKDANGNVLATNGKKWNATMSHADIAWVANEGIRVSHIMDYLANYDWNVEEQAHLLDLLNPNDGPLIDIVEGPMRTADMEPEWYARSRGYDPDFLGENFSVDLPKLPSHASNDIAKLIDGSGSELKYTNFSVIMNKSRRLAQLTAVNINGAKLKKIKRSSDHWYFDPRIDRKHQAGPDLYSKNDLDRGHLVRRLDPVWGRSAATANDDTFHFTNCAPQHMLLNRRSWKYLEDYILRNSGLHDINLSVFTGPIFRADDRPYRGYRIPSEFWKVVAFLDNGRLSATAYLQSQKNLLTDFEFAFGQYKTYQVPIAQIESITGLDFGGLRNHDPIADIESAGTKVISEYTDLSL